MTAMPEKLESRLNKILDETFPMKYVGFDLLEIKLRHSYKVGFLVCYSTLEPVIREMREALEYYGSKDKYIIHKNGKHFGVPLEQGEKARSTLEKAKEVLG